MRSHLSLVLLDAPHERKFRLEIGVHAGASVSKTQRLRFDPVHEDHTHARERVVVELAVRRLNELTPGETLPFQGCPLRFEQVESHGNLLARLRQHLRQDLARNLSRLRARAGLDHLRQGLEQTAALLFAPAAGIGTHSTVLVAGRVTSTFFTT